MIPLSSLLLVPPPPPPPLPAEDVLFKLLHEDAVVNVDEADISLFFFFLVVFFDGTSTGEGGISGLTAKGKKGLWTTAVPYMLTPASPVSKMFSKALM